MKRFRQFKLTNECILLFSFGVIILLYSAFPDYYSSLDVQAQLQQQPSSIIGIKITSPVADQEVPVGELTISGISTDNVTTDCTVYADWNNLKPFQTAVATGPGGVNDYSTWNFTYTPQYHTITNGTNDLAAQISCFNGDTLANNTKSYSVNVTGITESSEQSALAAQNVSSPSLPSVKIDNDDNKTATTTPLPQIIPSVPTTSPLPLQPAIKDDEEKEQTEEEPEPESEPQPTTSSTEDDTIEEDTDGGENPSEQGQEVEEIQEEEEVQEQLQQILEKVGKVEEDVQQEVGKIREDVLEDIESGLR
ncbi:MAG: hypothetical protein M3224_07390 [Thermoproteota archaeon]|nr:hypothetical protein [Thermoproteota archaeon]